MGKSIFGKEKDVWTWGDDWFKPEGAEALSAWREIIALKTKYVFQWPRRCGLTREQANRIRNNALRENHITILPDEKSYYERCIKCILRHYTMRLISRGTKESHADEARRENVSKSKLKKSENIKKFYLQLWENNPQMSIRRLNDLFFREKPNIDITSKTLWEWRKSKPLPK